MPVEHDHDAAKANAPKRVKTEPGGTPAPTDLVFKVVAYQGARHGFRLEQIFWRVLRFAAVRVKKPVNAYIAAILANAEGNKSAALRVHVADWLTRQLVEARSHAIHPSMLKKIVAALPQASIVVDLNHRVIAQNEAFLQMLRQQVAEPTETQNVEARIRLVTPVDELRAKLDAIKDPYVEDTLRVDCGQGPVALHARVCQIDAANGASLGLLVMIVDQAAPDQ